jgi:hypothetical protein
MDGCFFFNCLCFWISCVSHYELNSQVVDAFNQVLRYDEDKGMKAVGVVGGMSESRQRRLLSYRSSNLIVNF